MRKYLIFLICILLLIIFKIPKYNELNNLIIIKSVELSCSDTGVGIDARFKEIIPKKDENGITYEYKYYEGSGKNIDDVIKSFDEKKVFYYEKSEVISKNCSKKQVSDFLKKKDK